MRRFFGILVVGLVVFISCKTKPTPSAAEPAAAASAQPKITMFYAPEPVVAPGEPATLCYGTESVDTLVLDPPAITPVSPSPNRCVEVKPSGKTTYTLTATSASGQSVKQSVEVAVDPKARRASPSSAAAPTGPHIHYFRVDSTTPAAGGTSYKLCFMTQNAERVELNPPAIPASRVALGCFSVTPPAPTSYTLTVTGKDGKQVSKSLKVGN